MILLGFILGGEMLILLEELADLAFEWTHKMLDLLYTHVFGMDDEASQKASAWTLFFLVVALIGWVGYLLYKLYLRAKATLPAWWAKQQAQRKAWWADLPWFKKLVYGVGYLCLVVILAMII